MDPRARILQPYTRRIDSMSHRIKRLLLITGLVILAMVMGFLIAILPPNMIIFPLFPVLLLVALALWIAPEQELHLDNSIRRFFLIFLFFSFVWPDYIAAALPGLGWVSLSRLFMLITFAVSLYALATSPRMRREILETSSFFHLAWVTFLIFVAVQALVTVGTNSIVPRWIFANIFWYFTFMVAAWVFRREGISKRFYQIILVGAAIQGCYGLWEFHYSIPWWTNHIPSFLRGDPALIESILRPRAGRGIETPRISSIYLTALTYAEYLALTLPFAMYAMILGKSAWGRAAAAALVALMLSNAVMTDARSAMVGVVIALFGFIGLWSLRRFWQYRHQRDLVGPAFVWSYPAIAVAGLLAINLHPRLRVMVLGGGQHAASNNARDIQWDMAIERALQNPFGHGAFNSGRVLGYTNLRGDVTIDSYPINLLMDYGVIGMITYMLFFILAMLLAVRTFMYANDSEEALAGPVAIALLSFIVIKTVLSQTENHYFAFTLAGLSVALAWRQHQRLQAEAPAGGQPKSAAAAATTSRARIRAVQARQALPR